jgi:hypothetical protein
MSVHVRYQTPALLSTFYVNKLFPRIYRPSVRMRRTPSGIEHHSGGFRDARFERDDAAAREANDG